MKPIASITLLILLACNVFGLSIAVLCLDYEYAFVAPEEKVGDTYLVKVFIPSLPYSGHVSNSSDTEQLFRVNDHFYNITTVTHESDTLYIKLERDESARQHFSSLAEMMQEVYADKVPTNPLSRAIKLLDNLFKTYLPAETLMVPISGNYLVDLPENIFPIFSDTFYAELILPDSPPPEIRWKIQWAGMV